MNSSFLTIKILLCVCIFSLSCKNEKEINLTSAESIFIAHTWMIEKASGKGAGYDFRFNKDIGSDPFQFYKVRIKLENNGTITGKDNNGNQITGATWNYKEPEKLMTIKGTGIFGIDGQLEVITLSNNLVEVKNMLDVPQLNAVIELNATLVAVN